MARSKRKRKFVRVYWVHLTVVDNHAHVAGVASGQWATLHTVHDTFQNGWHKARVDGSANNRIDEYELAAPRQSFLFFAFDIHLELLSVELIHCWVGHSFCVWLYDEVHFAELSCATALLLVAIFSLCLLGNGFTIRYACFLEYGLDLLVVLQTPLQSAQVELALSLHDGLAQLFALLDNPRWVFLAHLQQGSHELFGFLRVHRLDGTHIFRVRILDEIEVLLYTLTVQCIASLDVFQLHRTANIACIELLDGDTVGSRTSKQLANALL